MKILVLGGTRFVGRRLVENLVTAGNLVTVVSRHPDKCPVGAHTVGAERDVGLSQLAGRDYDVIFDFIAYDGLAPNQVFERIGFGSYILISSTWITRISKGINADQPLLEVDYGRLDGLYEVTRKYLMGKIQAENAVLERNDKKKDSVVVRLPIVWGEGDHTGRLNFYLERISDGWPIICVGGAVNYAQLLWKEDIAACLCSGFPLLTERPIWEALPVERIKIYDLIKLIASAKGRDIELISFSVKQLMDKLPEYLMHEPLWQEASLDITSGNLFGRISQEPTPYSEWVTKISKQESKGEKNSLRDREIDFIRKTSAG